LKRFLLLIVPVLALAALLTLAEPAAASYSPAFPAQPVYRPTPGPIHPPGWDWWRTYPWSPYNYGRNPYNPIVVPPPYYVTPYPVATPAAPITASPAVAAPVSNGIEVSGPLSTPPPHTAIIRLRVPSYWAQVSINGQKVDSMGTSRTFVTPALSGQRSYTIAATWSQNGRSTRVHGTVRVAPDHIVSVDFTHPSK
jgi:uncharacterized protein (TIGR03000 family)